MKASQNSSTLVLATVAVVATCAALVSGYGWYRAGETASTGGQNGVTDDHAGHDHAGHDHEGHDHSSGEILHLSEAGLKNIDYQPLTVALSDYVKTLSLPAIIVERPGQTQIHVAAPFTGIVTEVYAAPGEAVEPGTEMFKLRLMHEELVAIQRDYLKTLEQLDVVLREIKRLETLAEGVIPEKRILDQKYEQQQLEATLVADQQAMLLHGLSEEQVDQIRRDRTLLRSIVVYAPDHFHDDHACAGDHLLHVQRLGVTTGQQVEAGNELCVLADHCELVVEGKAFEDDAELLRDVARQGSPIKARLLVNKRDNVEVEGLTLLYLADRVDPETRALPFYLRLPNEIVLDRSEGEGPRFIEWRYKPGQRLELHIPTEVMPGQIVLPPTAVVQEGPEYFVFRRDGDHFDRLAVHVKHRDSQSVVVSPLGKLQPGDIVAARGAYQMHLALKNQAGGAVDPHAGHNH